MGSAACPHINRGPRSRRLLLLLLPPTTLLQKSYAITMLFLKSIAVVLMVILLISLALPQADSGMYCETAQPSPADCSLKPNRLRARQRRETGRFPGGVPRKRRYVASYNVHAQSKCNTIEDEPRIHLLQIVFPDLNTSK
jgi:hypothetical protein